MTLNTRPIFTWSLVPEADHYVMRLDTVNPPLNTVYNGSLTTFTPSAPLMPVTYYWQVAAVDAICNISSADTRTLMIMSPDNSAPPRNYFTTNTPSLTWSRITWANTYQIEVDDTLNFSSPLDFAASVSADKLAVFTSALANNTYYWHVRACPETGACSAWSTTDSFVVDS
jgi:hypothetical protein